jgi:hypothetical protein
VVGFETCTVIANSFLMVEILNVFPNYIHQGGILSLKKMVCSEKEHCFSSAPEF